MDDEFYISIICLVHIDLGGSVKGCYINNGFFGPGIILLILLTIFTMDMDYTIVVN